MGIIKYVSSILYLRVLRIRLLIKRIQFERHIRGIHREANRLIRRATRTPNEDNLAELVQFRQELLEFKCFLETNEEYKKLGECESYEDRHLIQHIRNALARFEAAIAAAESKLG